MPTSIPTQKHPLHPRDEFSPDAKELLAKRSGYICAYPGCRRMTVAGSEDRKSGLTLVGVAAHITAAAPGGPRYDPLMGHDERSSESNGIWTCQIHGKFIDDNPSVCTTEELRRWKGQHEQWVFDRVASGAEFALPGTTRVRFNNVGVLKGEHEFRLGRHNILVGPNEAGKTTVAEIISAFSGGVHWNWFNERFGFSKTAASRSYITATSTTSDFSLTVALSPQARATSRKTKKPPENYLHIQVNGNVAADWPRTLFRAVNLDGQLILRHGDPKTRFAKAIRYLANVFSIDETTLSQSIREETYANTALGYRFRQSTKNKIEILVPDGRTFFLRTESLSSSELCLAIVDIALKLILSSAPHDQWILILDSGFFGRLDSKAKTELFSKLTSINDRRIQTLFCLSVDEDAEPLRQAKLDTWVSSARLDRLTLHAFA